MSASRRPRSRVMRGKIWTCDGLSHSRHGRLSAPHGMCTTHKDQVNAGLLAFLIRFGPNGTAETSHVLQHIDFADPQSSRRLR